MKDELKPITDRVRSINTRLVDRSTCFYCGAVAGAEDHVVPHSFRHDADSPRRNYEIDTLPACSECNNQLNNRISLTLKSRCEYLASRLNGKYRKHLSSTQVWTVQEFRELSRTLQASVMARLSHRKQLKQRLTNLTRENAEICAISVDTSPASLLNE